MPISHKKVPLAFSYSMNDCVLDHQWQPLLVRPHPQGNMQIQQNIGPAAKEPLELEVGSQRDCLQMPGPSTLEYACAVWNPHLKNDIYNI